MFPPGVRDGTGRNEKEELSYEENSIFGTGGSYGGIRTYRLRAGEVRRQQIQRQMLRPRKQREAKLLLIRQRERHSRRHDRDHMVGIPDLYTGR